MVPASVKSVVSQRTIPDQNRNAPNVMTNDGTPSFVMIRAWNNPIAVVSTRVVMIAAHQGHPGSPGRCSRTRTAPPVAATNATDRSIVTISPSAMSSTKMMPIARKATGAI